MPIMNFCSGKFWMFFTFATHFLHGFYRILKFFRFYRIHRIFCKINSFRLAVLLCFSLIFNHVFAKDIENYMRDLSCKNKKNLCDSVENLREALAILTKIQNYNFALMQKGKIDSKEIYMKNKDEKPKEAKDFKKNDIVMVTYAEYQSLRQYMGKFCKKFEELNEGERKTLFTLEWNNNPIFQNNDDVAKFCKSKH